VTIGADPSRALAVADPRWRALAISLGCSAASVLVAAAASGLGMTLEIAPDGSARLDLAGTEADHALARLFPALTSRVTDKRSYPPETVEPPQLAWPQGIGVHYVAPERTHRFEDVLARTRFGVPQQLFVPGLPDLLRDSESVLSGYLSLSSSAPHLFGDRLDDFAGEVRALLASRSAEDIFWDWPGDTEVIMGRKPGDRGPL